MKILVTGGTGFVGRHLQQELGRRGIDHDVFSARQHDLTDCAQADEVFRQHRDVDVIIHMASYQAAGDFPARHPAQQLNVNGLIHLHCLEAWRRFTPTARFIAIGSSCAYPDRGPLIESRFLDGDVHGSVFAYAFTKRLLYKGMLAYEKQYGLKGAYLVPATMFGEYDDFHVDTAHVCGALIGKFVKATLNDEPEVEVWGDGTQIRDFMDVKQFVGALLHLLERDCHGLINVGPGVGTSIRDLAHMIAEAADYPGELRFDGRKYTGVQEKVIAVEKFKGEYGGHIEGGLPEALARTVAWYRRHFERLHDRRKFAADVHERAA